MHNQERPKAVFYLSTGRAGSGTFAHLFQQSDLVRAFHVPSPELIEESFLVQQQREDPTNLLAEKLATIEKLIGGTGKIYVETNPRLAFFIRQLNEHFDAKFIWVIRDPLEYVNSGLSRRWYSGQGGVWDEFRERPIDGWPSTWDATRKIAWQWCCINSFIETQTASLSNVRVAHFSELRSNPEQILDILHWAGARDITLRQVKSVLNLNINVGKYSAPRDPETGDHVFGKRNSRQTEKQTFDKNAVIHTIANYWDSPEAKRYMKREVAKRNDDSIAPSSYEPWLRLLKQHGAAFCRYTDIISPSPNLRCFLRHDIDFFDEGMMNECRDSENAENVRSTWFFLPPRDKRYCGVDTNSLRRYIRSLQAEGFFIGYHVNAWETPGTYELCTNPLQRIDEDIEWFSETLGEPLRVAVAHGIPHHKDFVSNFSMFDALQSRGVLMLDQFIIHDDGSGKMIPHFGSRSRNPLFPTGLQVSYASDSGGPIRRDWEDVREILSPGNNIVINTHCANYSVRRSFEYIDATVYDNRFSRKSTSEQGVKASFFSRIRNLF